MKDLIFDKSIAFGLTPFETIYFVDNNAQHVREHYNRLLRACRILEIGSDAGISFEDFEKLLESAIQQSGDSSGVLKIVAANGTLSIQGRQPGYNRDMYQRGMRLTLSRTIRDKHNILSYFKTFNSGISYVEDQRAKKRGFDSSLHLNQYGSVCECAFANIFFVHGKTIATPVISNGLLGGIMRARVLKAAAGLGYAADCIRIGVEEMKLYEECFITNSVAGVFPVSCIDGLKFNGRSFSEAAGKLGEFVRPWCGEKVY